MTNGNLKSNTVRSYISSLKIIHELGNFEFNVNMPLINAMLRGAENLDLYNRVGKKSRKVMTMPLLRIIGHQIAKTEWNSDSKIIVWCVCTVAFFGAFRIGELLAENENSFCPPDTLLWDDLKFRKDNSVLIHVKIDKCRNTNGTYIDLFEFEGQNCCPVKALKALKEKRFCTGKPVFQFYNGKNLTKNMLNKVLHELLEPIIGVSAYDISGHSFRAGLPAAMASNPDLINDCEIKTWGRWSSESYRLYTRLKIGQKRSLFKKIVNVLEN